MQLLDPRLPLIQAGQPFEGLVKSQHLDRLVLSVARASVSVTWCCWPPRLPARCAQAWSTRMCRISCAAAAKRCARSCQVAPGWPISRRYASFTRAVASSVWLARSGPHVFARETPAVHRKPGSSGPLRRPGSHGLPQIATGLSNDRGGGPAISPCLYPSRVEDCSAVFAGL